MDSGTWLNIGLVLLFVLIGGVFAATEMALVSLRESQLKQLERQSARGAKVAGLARDPNRFLSAVQIGVTVAGFFSAAYGASTIAPDVAPYLVDLGLPQGVADPLALILLTLIIAYLSLVLGELVPKRIALQRSSTIALAVAPPLDKFATVMRPVIWLLSLSTNAIVRLLRIDPDSTGEEMSGEELRELVSSHDDLDENERRILDDVFEASHRSLKEVMRPRGDVVFLSADQSVADAAAVVRGGPYSRYPVTGRDVDDVLGFLHVRDLIDEHPPRATVRDLMRPILALPSTNRVLSTLDLMQRERVHIAIAVDEYGGTDGLVTLEDIVEELVGDIEDEYDVDLPDGSASTGIYDAGLTIEEFAEVSGIELPDGRYETVAGYVIAQLERMPSPGDVVPVGGHLLRVVEVVRRRITRVEVIEPETPTSPPTDD